MASAGSMPSSDPRQDLKNLLECSICLKTFDDPRTLHCLHSFCKKCLENFVDGKHKDELHCPVCRCQFTLDKQGKNTVFTLKHSLLQAENNTCRWSARMRFVWQLAMALWAWVKRRVFF